MLYYFYKRVYTFYKLKNKVLEPEEERRRSPRIELRTSLHFHVRGTSQFENALSENIGMGGIGLVCNEYIAPATLVMLEINILSRILRPIGKIVSAFALPHSDRNRLGIEFLEFDSAEKNYLKDYINMQLRHPQRKENF